MDIIMILSYKIQFLLTKSTHILQKLLASIYDSKIFSAIKHNYYIVYRVIKVHVKQTEERIVIRKKDEQNRHTCLKGE